MSISTISKPQVTKETFTSASGLDLDLSAEILDCIRRALDEDIGAGDITTNSIVSTETLGTARIIAKQSGVLSGSGVAQAVFLIVNPDHRLSWSFSDGALVQNQAVLLEVAGKARDTLTAERTALNFLARMSGIATLTRQFVDAIAGTGAVILDTRKTAPGLRAIDKLAVRHGGGCNHRFGLYDMVLIKNNHIDQAGSVSKAVKLAREAVPDLEFEVEARTIAELDEALSLGIERVLLDNMTIDELRDAVTLCAGRAQLEASGNVTLKNVRAIAATGVDFISVGALTHSAQAFDMSLRWDK